MKHVTAILVFVCILYLAFSKFLKVVGRDLGPHHEALDFFVATNGPPLSSGVADFRGRTTHNRERAGTSNRQPAKRSATESE